MTEPAKIDVSPHNWTDAGAKVLILKAVDKNGIAAHANFKWPESGAVECQDWNPEPVCGGGLHGWPWGMGIGEGRDYDLIDDKWIVYAADPTDIVGEIDKGSKCKARKAEVIYFGSFAAAWAMINGGRHRCIEVMSKQGGYSSTAASSGNYSKAASSGDYCMCASVGINGRVKVGIGGAFAIGCKIGDRLSFLVGQVGVDGIVADTWYAVVDGKLVMVKEAVAIEDAAKC